MTQDIVAFPRLTMLTREQCEIVHHASLEILRRTGVRVYHDEVLALLRDTDAVITDESLSRSKIALRGLPNPRFWPGSGDPGRAKLDLLSLVHLPAGLVE